MRHVVGWLSLLVFALAAFGQADERAVTYYVQLVRGTDGDKPPAPACRPAGPRLVATFRPVMKWKNYWEISCKSVTLNTGQTSRIRLGNGREVEIDLRLANKRQVTAYQDGVMVDRTISPLGASMTITGGDRDPQSVWFIVVRRDKPSAPKDAI
jgi:hypothetical protein